MKLLPTLEKIKILTLFLAIIFCNISYSQDTIHFDRQWKITEKQNAQFYRVYTFNSNKKTGFSKDYFITGELKMVKSVNFVIIKGEINAIANGLCTTFYKNGNKESEVNLSNNKNMGLKTYWQQNGNLLLTENYFFDTLIDERIYYYPNKKVHRKEFFEKGLKVKFFAFDENGNELPLIQDRIMPEFLKGGMKGLEKFISETIEYPEFALKNKIEGQVIVSFVIDTTGKAIEIEIIESTNSIFNEESKRIIKKMPNWSSGKIDNKPANIKFTFPINFKL